MRPRALAWLFMALGAAVALTSCIDVFVGPRTYGSRTVKLVEEGNQKVARLGGDDLVAGRCTLRADAVYVLKPDGEAVFQGSTMTTRAGDTWRQTGIVTTMGGTTIVDSRERAQQMDEANKPYPWEWYFHFAPSLYKAMDQVAFQGGC